MNKEVWKPVKGREQFYEVSSLGNIRSLVNRYKNKEVLKPYTNPKGYQSIDLAKPDLKKYLVHRLVAEAFCDKPEGCNVVNHIDNNPSNNNFANLEWTTTSGNLKHAQNQGRLFEAQSKGGKVTAEKMTDLLFKETQNMIGKTYGNLTVLSVGSIVKYGNANRPKLVAKCTCGSVKEYDKIQLDKHKAVMCRQCAANLLGFRLRQKRIDELKNTQVNNFKFTGNSNNSKDLSIDNVTLELIDTTTNTIVNKPYKLVTSKQFLSK